MRMLTAFVAVRPFEPGAAVEAIGFVRMTVRFSGLRLDGTSDHSAGDCIANRFEIAHPVTPVTTLGGVRGPC